MGTNWRERRAEMRMVLMTLTLLTLAFLTAGLLPALALAATPGPVVGVAAAPVLLVAAGAYWLIRKFRK
jgi:lipopolysaccharide export LptBFGC system permease protein LptF